MNYLPSIHQAVRQQNLSMVESLLAQDNSIVNSIDSNHNTPLIYAVQGGNSAIAHLLMEKGANVNYQNHPHKMSALMFACAKNYVSISELLITSGADVNLTNDDRTPPLMIACYWGYKEIAELLLKNGAMVNSQDIDGDTPLQIAIKKNHSPIIELLISHGADLYQEEGALNLAIDYHKLDIVKTLIKESIDVNRGNKDGFTPLMNACAQGDIEIVRVLLEAKAQVNLKDSYQETALHLACLEGHFQIVEALIKKGADVNAINSEKDSPLLIACVQGHSEIVAELLKNGANPNYANGQDYPLTLAIINNWQEITYYLLQAGANPDVRLADGKTVLMKVCDQNNLDMIRCLLHFGADVNLEDKGGGTALMWSAHRGHLEGVKLLIEVEGINIHHRNQNGYTASSLAEYNQFDYVTEFLNTIATENG